ncbi:hypothetical protein TNCV_3438281 [Trichonephila clavipes]|nr:hypothetical protein TNCV_3438281 [Trichonephila clavipes]
MFNAVQEKPSFLHRGIKLTSFGDNSCVCDSVTREIDQCVGRNQATVMRICHRMIQGETTDQRGRSYPPRSITVHDDSRIARMAEMDRAAPSRTIAQQNHFITHHSVFVVTFDAVCSRL